MGGVSGGGVITLEAGWRLIEQQGLKKLYALLREGTLQEQQQTKSNGNGVNHSASSTSSTRPAAQGFTNEEYAKLYTIIYQMCIQKAPYCWTPQLYERYEQAINQYLESVTLPALRRVSGAYLLREMVRRWDDHGLMRKWLYDFFRYLDRFYVKRHGKKNLNDVALLRFRAIVFEPLKAKLTQALLEAIKKDRNGEEVEREVIKRCVHIYVDMGMGSLRLYQHEFERPFLESSREYYAREAASWLATDSCPDYLRKCEKRFNEERRRARQDIVHTTEAPLMQVLNDALLMQHQRELLTKEHSGVRALLKSHAESDLTRLYQLYSAVPQSLPFIASMLQAHIIEVGVAIMQPVQADQQTNATRTHTNATSSSSSSSSSVPAAASSSSSSSSSSAPPSPANLIEQLMRVHETYFELVRHCFSGHATFQKALKEAFENILNRPPPVGQSSSAELVATYADLLLRKGGLSLEESAVERALDQLVRLFSYLQDKDMFVEFSRKQLATRLLTQRSASRDAERSMIGKLKLLMGAQFTSKLEGMFNDMRQAAEHVTDFQRFCMERQLDVGGIELTVQTLTTGFWPSYPIDDIQLPTELSLGLQHFKVYYDTRTSNRRLTWIHELGTVTMGANLKRRLELVMSTLQAAVLLHFNTSEELSIEQLIHYTSMTPDLIKATLKSLVSGKCKLLMKIPADGYNISHRIRVNPAFTSPQFRVRLPPVVRKEKSKERELATSSVAEHRKHAMEANIVRIMKARKVLPHAQLMAEVSQQLMHLFQPDPRQIKQRIEDLIQREYMKRDEEQSNVYHYLA